MLNPFAQVDVFQFEGSAKEIADQIKNGDIREALANREEGTIRRWGLLLSPFWLLPGPSDIYAKLASATVATLGVYNVYMLASYYHSKKAGVISVLPLMVMPSVVLLHGTIMREALIFFSLTTIARLGSTRLTELKIWEWHLMGICGYLIVYLRPENLILILVTMGCVLGYYLYESGLLSKGYISLGILSISPLLMFFRPKIYEGIIFLHDTRAHRARGRAVYLPNALPSTLTETIAFSWIGAMYFLFAPFPWMANHVRDVFLIIEGAINITMCFFALSGITAMYHKNKLFTVGLMAFLLSGVILYGMGTANYGIAARHRQSFLWIIYLFAGVGIADNYKLKV